MPWTALPFKSGAGHELASALDIHGIPSLVLLEPDGSVITTDARSELRDDPDAEVCSEYIYIFLNKKVGQPSQPSFT